MSTTATIRVIAIRPLNAPVVEEIPAGLAGLYSVCDSPVTALGLTSRVTLWCNDEGRLNGMPPNRKVPDERAAPDFSALGLDVIILMDSGDERDDPPGYGPGSYHRIHGPFLLAGTTEDGDTVSLTDEEIAEWLPRAAAWEMYVLADRRCLKCHAVEGTAGDCLLGVGVHQYGGDQQFRTVG